MLSDEQKRVALKKNMEAMSKQAKKLRADGVEGITLTYYADEESFQKMRLEVETEDFAFRQMMLTIHQFCLTRGAEAAGR